MGSTLCSALCQVLLPWALTPFELQTRQSPLILHAAFLSGAHRLPEICSQPPRASLLCLLVFWRVTDWCHCRPLSLKPVSLGRHPSGSVPIRLGPCPGRQSCVSARQCPPAQWMPHLLCSRLVSAGNSFNLCPRHTLTCRCTALLSFLLPQPGRCGFS